MYQPVALCGPTKMVIGIRNVRVKYIPYNSKEAVLSSFLEVLLISFIKVSTHLYVDVNFTFVFYLFKVSLLETGQ